MYVHAVRSRDTSTHAIFEFGIFSFQSCKKYVHNVGGSGGSDNDNSVENCQKIISNQFNVLRLASPLSCSTTTTYSGKAPRHRRRHHFACRTVINPCVYIFFFNTFFLCCGAFALCAADRHNYSAWPTV